MDPKQERLKLKPYSFQVSGMLNDVYDEVDLSLHVKEIVKHLGHSVAMVDNVHGHFLSEMQRLMVDRLDELSRQ